MEWNGDRATVLPDNTAAMLHFSDQFAQREQQKQQRAAALAKSEQERRVGIQKYLGDKLDNKEFVTNSTYEGQKNNGLNAIRDEATAMMIKGASQDQVMAFINEKGGRLKERTMRIQEVDKNIAAGAAEYAKNNPGVDMAALIALARKDASYERLPDGTERLRDMAEVDPAAPWVQGAFQKYATQLFGDKAVNESWNETIKKERLAKHDVASEYALEGNRLIAGYKGDIPGELMDVADDGEGGKKAVLKTQFYSIPGQPLPYTDPKTKEPIPVLPPELYKKFSDNPAIIAGIEKKVQAELSNPANFNASGSQNFGPDSDYADMLRQKFMYNAAKAKTENVFRLNNDKNIEADKIRQYNGELRKDKQLELSIASSDRASQVASATLAKATGASDVEIRDLYKEVKDITESANPGNKGKAFNLLSSTSQKVILDYVKSLYPGDNVAQSDVYLSKNKATGNIVLKKSSDDVSIMVITPEDINAKVNTSVKEKPGVLSNAKKYIKETGKNIVNKFTGGGKKEAKKEKLSW